MFGQQVDVLLCHAPVPSKAVKAVYQYTSTFPARTASVTSYRVGRLTAQKYIENPPEGIASEDIRNMSEDDLWDMDYFLNEDDPFDDLFGEEGFYIF